jgi:hypothetical protein
MKTEGGAIETIHVFQPGDIVLYRDAEHLFWSGNGKKATIYFVETELEVPISELTFTGKVNEAIARRATQQ